MSGVESVTRDASDVFTGKTCTAPAARSERMRDIVVRHVPRDRAIRLLDLGCGTGSLVFRLAAALPQATLVGIDISPANIRAARAHTTRESGAGRVQFEVVNYLDYAADPFDVIVADGVLHLIPADTDVLFRKLARDLVSGGVLVSDMAVDGIYNRAFAALRRALGRVRTPWLDAQILRIGKLLHGHEMDDRSLRERVDYMYIPPERVMDERLRARAASAGLRVATEYAVKSTSLSELNHRVTVFTREEGVAR